MLLFDPADAAAVAEAIRVAGFRGGGFRRAGTRVCPLADLGFGLGYYGYPYYSSYYLRRWVNICY